MIPRETPGSRNAVGRCQFSILATLTVVAASALALGFLRSLFVASPVSTPGSPVLGAVLAATLLGAAIGALIGRSRDKEIGGILGAAIGGAAFYLGFRVVGIVFYFWSALQHFRIEVAG